MSRRPSPPAKRTIVPGPLKFPQQPRSSGAGKASPKIDDACETADDVIAAFATVSRRINDLARELKCLGYFDDNNDSPRAA